MSKHEKFILTPIINIIKDSIISCSSISNGINSFPLSDYVMQTTFLKITGASEQKLKCLLWELATDDYEFRYNFLKDNYGECSNYESKEKTFQNLLECIKKINTEFDINDSEKSKILQNTKNECEKYFNNSIFSVWYSKLYREYEQIINFITDQQFFQKNKKTMKLFSNKDNLPVNEKNNNLKDIFDSMYKHRNRCAHNLLSYQDNLPSLEELKSEENKYDNWFLRFFILILLDNIFIYIFKEYIKIRSV